LTHTAAAFDPRTTLARPDLAEQALEGLVRAEVYREVTAMQCVTPVASIRIRPDSVSEQTDQLVFGEGFDVLDRRAGQVWGRARRDGVVGWVASESLAATVTPPTHRVSVLSAPAHASATSANVVMTLTLNALVSAGDLENGRAFVGGAGWVDVEHLAALDQFDADPGETAERFVGVPFQAGGRTALGTNCTGLVQQALYACGLGGPRFCDEQSALGRGIRSESVRRGDLVVWNDHTGVMLDAERVVHASSHHGAVAVEALGEADERERAGGSEAPVFRRVTL
tara:strand:+ start:596 stop:1444 length:849 start_codon:yes stop_codon:yes gene_type:complete